jgi:hypothetical protein
MQLSPFPHRNYTGGFSYLQTGSSADQVGLDIQSSRTIAEMNMLQNQTVGNTAVIDSVNPTATPIVHNASPWELLSQSRFAAPMDNRTASMYRYTIPVHDSLTVVENPDEAALPDNEYVYDYQ